MMNLTKTVLCHMRGIEPRIHEGEDAFRWCFKGGGQTTVHPSTSTQVTEPWSGQQPHLQYGFDEARRIYEGPTPQYFPESTVTPFTGYQIQAQDAAAQRAIAGSPLLQAGQGQALSTLQGDYLNPDISGVASSLDAQIRPRVGAQFAMSGRNLSPAHAGTYTDAFTNALAPYAFNANQAERGRMMDAARLSPQLAAADYDDISRLNAVGGVQQDMNRQLLQEDIDRWNFEQGREQAKLRDYLGSVTGSYGGTRSTTASQPYFSNPTNTLLGQVSSGVGIGQGLFGGMGK